MLSHVLLSVTISRLEEQNEDDSSESSHAHQQLNNAALISRLIPHFALTFTPYFIYMKNKRLLRFNILFESIACLLMATACIAQTNTVNNATTTSNMENTNGTTITLGGKAIHTVGKLPAVGTQVKDFSLTGEDLTEKTLAAFKGKYIIMNIFPSVNTGVCAKSVRTFNHDAAGLNNTIVLCISKDLPFAQKQFCGAEGIDRV